MVVAPSRDAIEGVFRVRGLRQGYWAVSNCPGIPGESLLADPNFATDKFRIHASFADDRPPQVWETEGRFEALAWKMCDETGKPLEECLWDLHIFSNGELCLGHKTTIDVEMRRNPGIRGFFERLLMPYFFFHAYRNKHGVPPWPGLSHDGRLATLEEIFYVRNDRDLLMAHIQQAIRKIDYVRIWGRPIDFLCWPACFCGSGKSMEECHPEAFKGALILSRAFSGGVSPPRR